MTEQSRGSGSDLLGDFQRWLLRSGARGMGRELGDQVRTAFGGSKSRDDVWGSATSEPAEGDAAECGWCPVCRAARLLRESGPGLMSHASAVGDVLATLLQDAVSVAESALANAARGDSAAADRMPDGAGAPDGAPPARDAAAPDAAEGKAAPAQREAGRADSPPPGAAGRS